MQSLRFSPLQISEEMARSLWSTQWKASLNFSFDWRIYDIQNVGIRETSGLLKPTFRNYYNEQSLHFFS
jgi:hypothetical protein